MGSDQPKPSIPVHFITVNYHCSDYIRDLIETTASNGDHDIAFVIVNNSPSDTSLRHWLDSAALPIPVTLLEAGGNLGFGSGCNLGLSHVWRHNAKALAWLINPDARLNTNAVAYVRECIALDPEIAILGTRIGDLVGNVWFSHGGFDPWLGRLRHQYPDDNCSPDPVRTWPTRWISGCSMVFRLASFDHCPQFDPQFFLDYEDADISERYHRKGYRLRVTQAVLVEHQVSAITKRAPRAKYQHATFSKLYFLHRHATPVALVLNLIYFALNPIRFCLSDPAMAQGRWWGLGDYLKWSVRRLRHQPTLRHPRTSFTVSS
jgi:N-acetylglucosaminyl-diphospho-decaprenol L-rhamnosyltransferase